MERRKRELPGLGRFESLRQWKRPLAWLFLIYLVGVSAILRADFNYADDLSRVVSGYKGWHYFSRHLTVFLSGIIHADDYLTDISPLPQILALMLLALTGVIVLHVLGGKAKRPIAGLIALVPLALSPYFLECISYKYDAPYMAISIFAQVFPILFAPCGVIPYAVATILGMLATCTTYQAALGVFPMLVIAVALRRWNNGEAFKSVLRFALISGVSYAIGVLIFQQFILIPIDSYASTNPPPPGEFIPLTLANYRQYFSLIRSDFKHIWKWLLAFLCAAFALCSTRDSKQNKVLAFLLSCVSVLAMLALCFGVYPFLTKPLFVPRGMYGFGVFIALIGAYVATSERRMVTGQLISLVLSWCFFVFAFTYGNALYNQKTYTDFRIHMVIDDLKNEHLLTQGEIKHVQLTGTIGYAPAVRNMPQDYQMLNRLVPINFADSHYEFAHRSFNDYYRLPVMRFDSSVDLSTYDLPLVVDNFYHTIYADDEHMLIELKP